MKQKAYKSIIFLAVYALMVMPLLNGGVSACIAKNYIEINPESDHCFDKGESSQTPIADNIESNCSDCIDITFQSPTDLDHITPLAQTNQAFSQSKIIGFPVNPFLFEGKTWKIQRECPSFCKLKIQPLNDVLLGLLTVRLQL